MDPMFFLGIMNAAELVLVLVALLILLLDKSK